MCTCTLYAYTRADDSSLRPVVLVAGNIFSSVRMYLANSSRSQGLVNNAMTK